MCWPLGPHCGPGAILTGLPQGEVMKRRKRITIIGLRNGQDVIVLEKCGQMVDLSILNGDTATTSVPKSDHVVVMTKFIEHRWTKAAHWAVGRDRVHLHRGGISKLVEVIRDLAV